MPRPYPMTNKRFKADKAFVQTITRKLHSPISRLKRSAKMRKIAVSLAPVKFSD